MKGYRLIKYFSVFCLALTVVCSFLIIFGPRNLSTTNSNFMFILLFVGFLGINTGNTLEKLENRVEKLERDVKKEV